MYFTERPQKLFPVMWSIVFLLSLPVMHWTTATYGCLSVVLWWRYLKQRRVHHSNYGEAMKYQFVRQTIASELRAMANNEPEAHYVLRSCTEADHYYGVSLNKKTLVVYAYEGIQLSEVPQTIYSFTSDKVAVKKLSLTEHNNTALESGSWLEVIRWGLFSELHHYRLPRNQRFASTHELEVLREKLRKCYLCEEVD